MLTLSVMAGPFPSWPAPPGHGRACPGHPRLCRPPRRSFASRYSGQHRQDGSCSMRSRMRQRDAGEIPLSPGWLRDRRLGVFVVNLQSRHSTSGETKPLRLRPSDHAPPRGSLPCQPRLRASEISQARKSRTSSASAARSISRKSRHGEHGGPTESHGGTTTSWLSVEPPWLSV